MDKLLSDYESSSAVKISPSPSEERLFGVSGGLSKTYAAKQKSIKGETNKSFNGLSPIIDSQTTNLK